jgi:hypothetical protein
MDPAVEQGDLLGHLEGDGRFGGDVGGEGFEVEAVVAPQGERRLGGGDDRGRSFGSPSLAAVVLEPAGQSGGAEPFDLVRVGVGGQEL